MYIYDFFGCWLKLGTWKRLNFMEAEALWWKVRLGTYLFVKVLQPGGSEVNFSVFKSSCHL